MPAMLEDPAAATIYRVTGDAPYPDPNQPSFPPEILPRHVTLRDRQTVATVVPFSSRHQVPESLLRYLSDQFNKEIEGGDTYPMIDPMPFDKFASYWFQNFAGIMLLGSYDSAEDLVEGKDWSKECLGTFYIKPNYPGRSSHVCNAGFIVTDASRNRGVGRLMGEAYLDWAPKLGYTYSVFNLVYETNVASCKIWDALGFKRIGRVKGAGSLKSHPDRFVDAIIFGRDLGDAAGGAGSDDLVSEERFEKIKFYLKYGRYPDGADRAEKSRLRSAATHYKLLEGDVLMLKDKEVISDPQRQYEIARSVHNQTPIHAGINKTTSTIAERYHWSRIKETVSDVIRNCTECKESGKNTLSQAQSQSQQNLAPTAVASIIGVKRPSENMSDSASKRSSPSPPAAPGAPLNAGSPARDHRPPTPTLPDPSSLISFAVAPPIDTRYSGTGQDMTLLPPPHHQTSLQSTTADSSMTDHHGILTRHAHNHNPMLQDPSSGPLHQSQHHHLHHVRSTGHPLVTLASIPDPLYQPIDPQIISQPTPTTDPHAHSIQHHHHHPHFSFDHPSPHHPDNDTFQALLNAQDEEDDISVDIDPDAGSRSGIHHHHLSSRSHSRTLSGARLARLQKTAEEEREEAEQQAAVERDLDMLIEQPQDDEDEDDHHHLHHRQQHNPAPVVVAGSGDMDLDDIVSPTDIVVGSLSGGGGAASDNLLGGSKHGVTTTTRALNSGSNSASITIASITDAIPVSSSTAVSGSGSGSNNMGKMDVSHLLSAHDDDDDIQQHSQHHAQSTRRWNI
ncbi:protein SPT10 [Rhypophila decipiens]|uniref:Protein SPT10 n=1 Tax=Rhypophila decipiens TaxID=261697 RepID=A0AAN6YAN5_9PEZI|nr:protein SPT10 [Rhypophila decipiens]